MGRAFWWIFWLVLGIGTSAEAQQSAQPDTSDGGSVSPRPLPTTIKVVTVYLHHANGRWSASLEGDIKDPDTEKVKIALADGSVRVLALPNVGPNQLCLSKMKNRPGFGYMECNSAFFSANIGATAASTLLRGVLSLGVLTVTEATSGNTGYSVSLDKQALDAAITEAKAIEFAREAAPLIEYRESFAAAASSRLLRDFIARYEGTLDPESLVSKAREKLPLAVAQEEREARQQTEVIAQQAESRRQQEILRLAKLEAIKQFQARLQPGDRVKVMRDSYTPLYAMVIEVKPPLAYLQWENVSPPMQWVRLENLMPPR